MKSTASARSGGCHPRSWGRSSTAAASSSAWGAVVADVPARSLADDGPAYERPMEPPRGRHEILEDDPTFAMVDSDPLEAFLAVLSSPNVASKQWAFEQYDQLVQGATVARPGSDAAVIRVEGTLRAL